MVVALWTRRVPWSTGVATLVATLVSPPARASRGPAEAYASPPPVYCGARPSPGGEDSDTGEGCVPWSPDRPDVHICGEVEEGFTPAPTPGGYADYKQVCDQAAQVFQERV